MEQLDPWCSSKDFLIIAHRGASGDFPENTMLAFREAIKQKAPAIELDIYNIQDELFVFHDDEVERLTGNKGAFQDFSVEAVKNLRVNKLNPIPTLHEVLSMLESYPDIGLNIELKGVNTALRAATIIRSFIARGFAPERLLMSSFRHGELSQFSKEFPEIKIGALLEEGEILGVQKALNLKSFSVHVSRKDISKEFVEKAHQEGLKVYVFTVNDIPTCATLQSFGVDGIFTDFPARFIKEISRI